MKNLDVDVDVMIHLKSLAGILPAEMLSGVEANMNNIAAYAHEYAENYEKAQKSQEFSVEGLQKRRLELARESDSKLKNLETTLSGLDLNISQTRTEMMRSPSELPGKDQTLRYLMEREIRDRLQSLTAPEIQAKYESNDPLIQSAIENAPSGFNLLPKAIIEEARVTNARRRNPELARKLDQMEVLKTAYAYVVASARRELRLPQGEDQPITF